MSFKLKRKPPRPYRYTNYSTHDTDKEEISLDELNKIIKALPEKHPNETLDNIRINTGGGYYDDYCVNIVYDIIEGDESFNKRMIKWSKKVKEYEQWLADNEEEVKLYKAKQKSKKQLKEKLKEVEETLKCSCTKDCGVACKGTCGCKFCHNAYQDFLSVE